MDFKKILFVLAAGIICLGVSSCKKEEESTYKSFVGSISFDLPPFVEVGEEVTVTPKGLYAYDDDTFGYSWKVSPIMSKSDTTKKESDPATVSGTFTYHIPDTLCNLEFLCTAFATGYYQSSTSHKTSIIDKEKSLSGRDFKYATDTFTDERDHKTYYIVRVGNTEWFCSNLAYQEYGVPYMNTAVTGDVFGQFYNWEEAALACPEGWRLPEEQDWIDLAKEFEPAGSFSPGITLPGIAGHMLSMAILNGEKDSLWEFWPKVKVTNEKSLNVIPSGYTYQDGDSFKFKDFGDKAVFWTGTPYGEDQAYYRYFVEGNPDVLVTTGDKKTFYATIRPVRDVK